MSEESTWFSVDDLTDEENDIRMNLLDCDDENDLRADALTNEDDRTNEDIARALQNLKDAMKLTRARWRELNAASRREMERQQKEGGIFRYSATATETRIWNDTQTQVSLRYLELVLLKRKVVAPMKTNLGPNEDKLMKQ
jgi:hypothetical protein